MSFGHLLEYVFVALSMVGAVFIAHRDRRGYLIFVAAFFPGAAFAVYYRHWGLLLVYVYYLAVNCYGYYKWGISNNANN